MGVQSEQVAHSNLVNGALTSLHDHALRSVAEHGNESHKPAFAEQGHNHDGSYEAAGAVSGHVSAYNHGLLHSNSLDHDGTAQDTAIASKTTLAAVKADADVAGAISHSVATHAPANAQKNSDITQGEIEAKLTGVISSHSHAGGGGEEEVVVVLTSAVPNATANLANATGLTFIAEADSIYLIEVFLVWNTTGTAVGIKVSAMATNSPTVQAGHFITDAAAGTPDSSSWNANDVVTTTSASAFTTNNVGKVAAILKTAGSASTWQLRFAAETTGTITLQPGTTLRYRKVA